MKIIDLRTRCVATGYFRQVAALRPLGDIDGVLVVPREIAYEVLMRAEEIIENEKMIFGWVHEGQSIQAITEKGGYF